MKPIKLLGQPLSLPTRIYFTRSHNASRRLMVMSAHWVRSEVAFHSPVHCQRCSGTLSYRPRALLLGCAVQFPLSDMEGDGEREYA